MTIIKQKVKKSEEFSLFLSITISGGKIMQRIVVDPGQLDNAANRVDSQNQEYERIYNSLYTEVDKMSNSWQGKDNLEFTNKVYAFKSDFRQISLILSQYAQFLRNSARAYRETQEELRSSASRLYQGGE